MTAVPLRARRRSGFSLVECLTVIGIGAMLLTALTALWRASFDAERATRIQLAEQIALDQLTQQWRRDGHLAQSAAALGEHGLALIAASGLRVEYVPNEASLVRTVTRNGQQVQRDEFRLPLGMACELLLPDSPTNRLLRLALIPREASEIGATPEPPREFLVAMGAAALEPTREELQP